MNTSVRPVPDCVAQQKQWQALRDEAERIKAIPLAILCDEDLHRSTRYQIEDVGITLNYARQRVDHHTMDLLLNLAKTMQLPAAIDHFLRGGIVNSSERQPALHCDARAAYLSPDNPQSDFVRMDAMAKAIHNGEWLGYSGKPMEAIVHIGIGGSVLGVQLVVSALSDYHQSAVQVFFVSNVDYGDLASTLAQLNPQTTLFVVVSKSFTTAETQLNARSAREWLVSAAGRQASAEHIARHFIAVTAQPSIAASFDIAEENILPMGKEIGGRYSLWSAASLSAAVAVGMDHFRQFLQGAHMMDCHFHRTPLSENLPVILGLLSIWQSNFCDAHTQLILPYDYRLRYFPVYIQQVIMESNGKSVRHDGTLVPHTTAPAVWGEQGTNGQHSFHQWLHQGHVQAAIDFIVTLRDGYDQLEHRSAMVANCLAQSQCLMRGLNHDNVMALLHTQNKSKEECERLAPHLVAAGDRPSNLLVVERLTPNILGALAALYEHRVFVESVLWDINAFDQWGVEHGKHIARDIEKALQGSAAPCDAISRSVVERYRKQFSE